LGVHELTPGCGALVPAGQVAHEVPSTPNVPAGHGVHLVELATLYDPKMQGMHENAAAPENDPGTHDWHSEVRKSKKKPGAHWLHVKLPPDMLV